MDVSNKPKPKKRGLRLPLLIVIAFTLGLFTIFYLLPNVIGQSFIDIKLSNLFVCNKLIGFMLVIHNSYFRPVVLTYAGADVTVDLLDKNNLKIFGASFLSEKLHDEEEGFMHVVQLPSGTTTFILNLNESTQYYKNPRLPSFFEADDSRSYRVAGNAFGINIKTTSSNVKKDKDTSSWSCDG